MPQLTGSENYPAWRDISQYVLEHFNSWNIGLGEERIDVTLKTIMITFTIVTSIPWNTSSKPWSLNRSSCMLAITPLPKLGPHSRTILPEQGLDLSSTNWILFAIPSTIHWFFVPIISINTILYGIDYTSDVPLPPPRTNPPNGLSFKQCSSHRRLKQAASSVLFLN